MKTFPAPSFSSSLVSIVTSAVVALGLAAGCKGDTPGAGDGKGPTSGRASGEVVVYTSVDQVFSAPVFRACQEKTGLEVRGAFDTEETKSTGIVNRLIAEAAHPQADVFWSNDPVRPYLLAARGLVDAYAPPVAAQIPATFHARPTQTGTAAKGAGKKPQGDLWVGFAARARVLLVNTDEVPAAETPTSLLDLTSPRWRGQVAIANPLYGTTTMHVGALAVAWGDQRLEDYLDALKANGVRVASSNGEVKRLVVAGEVAVGLTDTDDAHEALESHAHVRVVYPDQDARPAGPGAKPAPPLGTLVMPTAAVLLRGAPHPEAARALIDCLVSADTERRLAVKAAHMPLLPGVPLPKAVQASVRRVEDLRAMDVDYRAVAQAMERLQPFLRRWAGM